MLPTPEFLTTLLLLPHTIRPQILVNHIPILWTLATTGSLWWRWWRWRWSGGGLLHPTSTTLFLTPPPATGCICVTVTTLIQQHITHQYFIDYALHHLIFCDSGAVSIQWTCYVPLLPNSYPIQPPTVGPRRVPFNFSVSPETPLSLPINSVVRHLFDGGLWFFADPLSVPKPFPPLLWWYIIFWQWSTSGPSFLHRLTLLLFFEVVVWSMIVFLHPASPTLSFFTSLVVYWQCPYIYFVVTIMFQRGGVSIFTDIIIVLF